MHVDEKFIKQESLLSALPQCGDYSRVTTIQITDVAATIYFSSTAMRRLFESGYYLRCGVYSRKYGMYETFILLIFYHNWNLE